MDRQSLIKSAQTLCAKFDQLIDKQESHLDDYVLDVKHKIDLHREQLIQHIHKMSNRMMHDLDAYLAKCKQNVANLSDSAAASKEKLNRLKRLIESNHDLKLIEKEFIDARMDMQCFDGKLKLNKSVMFIPTHRKVFGELVIGSELDESANQIEIIGSLNSPLQEDFDIVSGFDVNDEYGRLAIATRNSILVYDLQTFECTHTLNNSDAKTTSALKWLNGRSLKLASSSLKERLIKIWDLDLRQAVHQTLTPFEGNNLLTKNLFFVESNSHLISQSISSSKICVWGLKNDLYELLAERQFACFDAILTTNGSHLVSFDDRTNKLIALDTNQLDAALIQIDFGSKILCLEAIKDDEIALVCKTSVHIFDLELRSILKTINFRENFSTDLQHLKFINENCFLIVKNRPPFDAFENYEAELIRHNDSLNQSESKTTTKYEPNGGINNIKFARFLSSRNLMVALNEKQFLNETMASYYFYRQIILLKLS